MIALPCFINLPTEQTLEYEDLWKNSGMPFSADPLRKGDCGLGILPLWVLNSEGDGTGEQEASSFIVGRVGCL